MSTDIAAARELIERARELDSQIRTLARHAHVVIEALYALVDEAKAANIHDTLGFPSWTAYIADALDGRWKVERDKRGEVVRFLAAQGMSTRAIAKTAGVSKGTVGRELAGAPSLGHLITGLDGKTYPRPESKPVEPDQSDMDWVWRRLTEPGLDTPATPKAALLLLPQVEANQRQMERIGTIFKQKYADEPMTTEAALLLTDLLTIELGDLDALAKAPFLDPAWHGCVDDILKAVCGDPDATARLHQLGIKGPSGAIA
jgi:hypothetical protein